MQLPPKTKEVLDTLWNAIECGEAFRLEKTKSHILNQMYSVHCVTSELRIALHVNTTACWLFFSDNQDSTYTSDDFNQSHLKYSLQELKAIALLNPKCSIN